MINRRFSIKKKLGEGRSAVYLCEDYEQSRKSIALKVLPSRSTSEEKKIFKDEFETIQKLDHPNIIQAFERGTIVELSENEAIQLGSKYLAMEYFDGKELLEYTIKYEDALKTIIAQISSVLFYLHQSRFIYYDLKPENILVKEIDGRPIVKLIDLGFAHRRNDSDEVPITGTAEYIAPEILKKQPHDHRVDLYSFGMLLYRLIYKKFPFGSTNHLEIYKSHIEQEFIFPEIEYSSELLRVIRKLLSKNPEERYFTSVQILYDLNIPINKYHRDWIPAQVFTNRTDILNILNRFINSEATGEVIIISGFEGSGKSATVREISSRYENIVEVPNDKTKTGIEFVRFLLSKLVFNDFVYTKLSYETLGLVTEVLSGKSENVLGELKSLVNKITSINNFILLLDDFNLYDSYAIEIFREILPVLQINGCKIILTEKSNQDHLTSFINNSVTLDLIPLTSVQVEEMINGSYASFFPKQEVIVFAMRHADFLPGNIVEFLRAIVLLNIIQFDYEGTKIVSNETSESLLINIYEEIYRIRYNLLNDNEKKTAVVLSSFELIPTNDILLKITGYSEDEFIKTVQTLQQKHILQSQSQAGLNFSSDGIKGFIYSQIADKNTHHKKIAESIARFFPQFNRIEFARQYQLCEDYDEVYLLLIMEAEEAEKSNTLKYSRNILEQLLKYPINIKQAIQVKLKLSLLYDILNDFNNALTITADLMGANGSDEMKNNLLLIHANALIRTSQVEKGIEILKSLLTKPIDEKKRIRIMFSKAGAEFDLGNYEKAILMCNEILNNSAATHDDRGDVYNLLGLIDVNVKSDLDSTLENFEKCTQEYNRSGSLQRIAAIECNIGNIYNIKGEFEKVEKHWNNSLEISSSFGNYYQQGQVLLNFGIYHFNKQNFENVIEYYKKAAIIFNTLGDKLGYGRSEVNFGEFYLFLCDYQNTINSLNNAIEIFTELQNTNEKSEALFLLGKTYFKIGEMNHLKIAYNQLKELLRTYETAERTKLNIKFLELLINANRENRTALEIVKEIANEYLLQEDKMNYFETMTYLINYLLQLGKPDSAFILISEKAFKSVCSSNSYFEAEKLYLLGEIAAEKKELYIESEIHYFQEAYKLVQGLNVTELTWKIFLRLAIFYYERGNLVKAKEHSDYGRALINYFADKFQNPILKDKYLEFPERKKSWEIFTKILTDE
jgi:serine/threonine protein kinase/tetratricopeptide (TPR) repeat protein